MPDVEVLILLLASIAVLALVAQRLAVPYPIVLVLGGLVIGLIPGLPSVRLDPDVVLLLFLPPLLSMQASVMSWRDFWIYRRPIFLLAVGCVLITATAVALTAWWLFCLPLAAGFVLGAVVSPPDAVAASAVAQRLKLPRRAVTILEGESLVNDATGLVAYKFAVAAVVLGRFSLVNATLLFVYSVVVGVTIGAIVGYVTTSLLTRVKDYAVMITLSLLVPYVTYLSAEHLGASGVLAAVASGLILGWQGMRRLSPATRIQAAGFWHTLVFLLNSVLFLLIGLQLPMVWRGLVDHSTLTLLGHAAIICAVVIVVRIVWVFPGAYLPRMLSRRVRETEPHPSAKTVLVVAWSGMRGVVSLAAAMALPLSTGIDAPFPGRDLIIFFTFSVILGTLVLQGLTLAPLIRWLGIKPDGSEERLESDIRLQLAKAAELRIAALAQEFRLPEASVLVARSRYEQRIARLSEEGPVSLGEEVAAGRHLRREAIAAERSKLFELRDRGDVPDELHRRLLREIDLEEERLA